MMKQDYMQIAGEKVAVLRTGTVVVGTGAAALRAAEALYDGGVSDLLIVTNHRLSGTSRNTGSDKQTYYKLTLGGAEGDSVYEMAETLFSGQAMDGDVALAEAAGSAAGFLHLVERGVAFPQNAFGEWIGYKTDHDPRQRATSAGPYTSKQMTECLERAVDARNIPFLARHQVIKYLTQDEQIQGVLLFDLAAKDDEPRYVVVLADAVVNGSGGPARVYLDTVYPPSQAGSFGMALLAGAQAKNMTEWQFGLASVTPPWNVSGSYMQVLPRLISLDEHGQEEEFLLQAWDVPTASDRTFLKGYQWPFDVRKRNGSSDVDLLVHAERRKGRKVYMDFRANIGEQSFSLAELDAETRDYLASVGAVQDTPIKRLRHMNEPAYQFYMDHGVDLEKDRLEIRLSAQHHNGGLAVDRWWQTSIDGLYAVGEAAGTHGVYRPGGSALNAGQVGAMRAARHIAHTRHKGITQKVFSDDLLASVRDWIELGRNAETNQGENARDVEVILREKMSLFAGTTRNYDDLSALYETLTAAYNEMAQLQVQGTHERYVLYRTLDTVVAQMAMVFACLDLIKQGGSSRGSAVYEMAGQECPESALSETQEIAWRDGFTAAWRDVRPLPEQKEIFENVWRTFREHGNVE